MKKRRELDALVNGKTNGRRKRKGQHDLLLENMSDSSEIEEFSVPGKTIVRKRGFCQFCATCVTVCGFCMLLACIIAIIALVWVHIELKQEIDDLRDSLSKVESGSQGTPEEFQQLHSKLQDLEKRLNDLQSGDKGLEKTQEQLTNQDDQITDLNEKVDDLKTKVEEASKTSVPAEMTEIQQTVAELGSDVKTAQTDIDALKRFKDQIEARISDMETKVQQQASSDRQADHGSVSVSPELLNKVDALATSLGDVNVSLSVQILSLRQISSQNQAKIQALSSNASALWSEVSLLKLTNEMPPSSDQTPPTNSQTPPPAVDTTVIGQIIHEAMQNYSQRHSTDMSSFNTSVQVQLGEYETRIATLETQHADVVSGAAFLEYKNTVEMQNEGILDRVTTMGTRTDAVEGRLNSQSQRITRLEQAQGVNTGGSETQPPPANPNENNGGGSNTDTGGADDFNPVEGSGGGRLIGENDGHRPPWLHLDTTEEPVSTIEESTVKPTESTSKAVMHSDIITNSQGTTKTTSAKTARVTHKPAKHPAHPPGHPGHPPTRPAHQPIHPAHPAKPSGPPNHVAHPTNRPAPPNHGAHPPNHQAGPPNHAAHPTNHPAVPPAHPVKPPVHHPPVKQRKPIHHGRK